ncbi:MAG TPA: HNH endonuclease [Candidatus Acidoferrum sp.]|nr:HNH endonuclease [Candidatus Acidoferrum sp.]
MKNKTIDAAQVWNDFEDLLEPGHSLSVHNRAVYSHLFRHSRLEGKLDVQFSLDKLALGTGMSRSGAREALRRLEARGVLHLVRHGYQARNVVRLNLPSEVRGVRAAKNASARSAFVARYRADIEKVDFLRYQNLRRSIHDREGGKGFYCLRRITRHNRCFDHVVPQANLGGNSYRNLVSCCHDCNSKKRDRPAVDLLRWLFRERKLSATDLRSRLRALDALAAGKLIPPLPGQGKGGSQEGSLWTPR